MLQYKAEKWENSWSKERTCQGGGCCMSYSRRIQWRINEYSNHSTLLALVSCTLLLFIIIFCAFAQLVIRQPWCLRSWRKMIYLLIYKYDLKDSTTPFLLLRFTIKNNCAYLCRQLLFDTSQWHLISFTFFKFCSLYKAHQGRCWRF